MSKPVKKQNIRYIKAKRDAERAKRADRTERADRAGRRRSYFLVLGSLLMAALLISRLYTLQIVNSERYLSDFQSRIRRTVIIHGTRGRILDKNGNVLADSVASYNITMNDLTDDSKEDNKILNERILEIIRIVDKNGGKMLTDFSIRLSGGSFFYKEMGPVAKARFLADVYGYADPDDMPAENLEKTAEEVIHDLADRFGISPSVSKDEDSEKEDRETLLKMVIARYNLSLNYYQKYIATRLASNVPEKTKKAIEKRFDSKKDGIQIEEEMVRRYPEKEAVYLSNIIGYTGEASEDYLSEHDGTDKDGRPDYREGDIVGLTGIEASQEEILHGRSGQKTFNVDSIGRVTDDPVENSEVSAKEQSYSEETGRDVYLTIDKDLQIAAYHIVENNLRNIILNKLRDSIEDQVISEDQNGLNITIPVSNVYASCLSNLIDTNHLTSEDATDTEKEVAEAIDRFRAQRAPEILDEIRNGQTIREQLNNEMKTYQDLLAQALFDYGLFNEAGLGDSGIRSSTVYSGWQKGKHSLNALISESIRHGWINTDSSYLGLETDSPSDDELYDGIMNFFTAVIGSDENTLNDRDMRNAIYKYVIVNREVSSNQVCHLLLDQEIVEVSDEELESFNSPWGESDYTFIYNRIRDMDLTPAQLHLYPSTASVVVTDPESGDVLAMVSYPGFDTNRINDEDYYQKLVNDPAKPLLNYATQQLTAPGSTFKLVTATAALKEKVIDTQDEVNCQKKATFKKVKNDPNPPKCWIYPGRHRYQNLEGAIANSCNMFFYEMGFRLGLPVDNPEYDEDDYDYDEDDFDKSGYNSVQAVEKIQKYAGMYGLDSVSGVEISESEPQLLTKDPIRGAIGQDTNAYTTASLARYVSAVANSGTNYKLTLIDAVQTEDGGISKNKATVANKITLEEKEWNAIHKGMRRVVYGYGAFSVLGEQHPVAGKTGTAQQTGMPDNALFIGYAPYYLPGAWNEDTLGEQEKLAIAVRIPNGYTSDYAARLASDVIRVFYDPDQLEQIVDSVVLEKDS